MDRVIKFRAWDKATSTMLTENDNSNDKYWKLYLSGGVSIEATWATGDVELMEFTGMTDKTGREVYEGDLIVFDDPLTFTYDKHLHEEIIWDQRRSPGWAMRSLELVEDEVFPTRELDAGAIANSGRIVGNVWENPELRPAQRVTLSRWIADNPSHFNRTYHHENPTR